MLLFGYVITKAPAPASKPVAVERAGVDFPSGTLALAPYRERHQREKVVDGLDHYIDARLGDGMFRID